MKKLSTLVVLGGLVLASCSPSGGNTAATVDGTDITVGQVEQLIFAEEGVIPTDQFAQFLAFSIQWEIIARAAEADYEFAPTEEEVADEADEIFSSVAAEGQTREEFLSERGVTDLFLQNIGRQGLTDLHIRGDMATRAPEPTDEEMTEARQVARALLTNVCVTHVLVGTEEEALDVQSRLDSGEELGVIAAEVSTDTVSAENAGILPCTTADRYVPNFRDAALVAPVGEIYPELVESTFGFHVLMVTDRQDANEAELPDDDVLAQTIQDQWVANELQMWFNTAMADAVVTIDPKFGTWQANPPTIIPPQG